MSDLQSRIYRSQSQATFVLRALELLEDESDWCLPVISEITKNCFGLSHESKPPEVTIPTRKAQFLQHMVGNL